MARDLFADKTFNTSPRDLFDQGPRDLFEGLQPEEETLNAAQALGRGVQSIVPRFETTVGATLGQSPEKQFTEGLVAAASPESSRVDRSMGLLSLLQSIPGMGVKAVNRALGDDSLDRLQEVKTGMGDIIQDDAQARLAELEPTPEQRENMSLGAQLAYDAPGMLGDMAAPLIVGNVTGGGPVGIAAGTYQLMNQVAESEYRKKMKEGLDPHEARAQAQYAAVAEALPEAIPLGKVFGMGKQALWRELRNIGLSEGASEIVTEVMNIAYEKYNLDKNISIKEAFARVGYAGLVGAVGGIGMGGAQAGVNRITEKKQQEKVEKLKENIQKQIDAGLQPQAPGVRPIEVAEGATDQEVQQIIDLELQETAKRAEALRTEAAKNQATAWTEAPEVNTEEFGMQEVNFDNDQTAYLGSIVSSTTKKPVRYAETGVHLNDSMAPEVKQEINNGIGQFARENLGDTRIVFITNEDVRRLRLESRINLEKAYGYAFQSQGTYYVWLNETAIGEASRVAAHESLLGEDALSYEQNMAVTARHEIGHIFFDRALKQLGQGTVKAFAEDYRAWYAMVQDWTVGQFVERGSADVRDKLMANEFYARNRDRKIRDLLTDPTLTTEQAQQNKEWVEYVLSPKEYSAEQIAAHLGVQGFTKQSSISAKWWQKIIDALRGLVGKPAKYTGPRQIMKGTSGTAVTRAIVEQMSRLRAWERTQYQERVAQLTGEEGIENLLQNRDLTSRVLQVIPMSQEFPALDRLYGGKRKLINKLLRDKGVDLSADERALVDKVVRQMQEDFKDNPGAATWQDFATAMQDNYFPLNLEVDKGRVLQASYGALELGTWNDRSNYHTIVFTPANPEVNVPGTISASGFARDLPGEGHFTQPNYLGHIRYFIRDGKAYVAEIQSDIFQRGVADEAEAKRIEKEIVNLGKIILDLRDKDAYEGPRRDAYRNALEQEDYEEAAEIMMEVESREARLSEARGQLDLLNKKLHNWRKMENDLRSGRYLIQGMHFLKKVDAVIPENYEQLDLEGQLLAELNIRALYEEAANNPRLKVFLKRMSENRAALLGIDKTVLWDMLEIEHFTQTNIPDLHYRLSQFAEANRQAEGKLIEDRLTALRAGYRKRKAHMEMSRRTTSTLAGAEHGRAFYIRMMREMMRYFSQQGISEVYFPTPFTYAQGQGFYGQQLNREARNMADPQVRQDVLRQASEYRAAQEQIAIRKRAELIAKLEEESGYGTVPTSTWTDEVARLGKEISAIERDKHSYWSNADLNDPTSVLPKFRGILNRWDGMLKVVKEEFPTENVTVPRHDVGNLEQPWIKVTIGDGYHSDPLIAFPNRAVGNVLKFGEDPVSIQENKRARFNWFIRWFWNPLQIEKENAHVPGVSRYLQTVRDWWTEKTQWTDRAHRTLEQWHALPLTAAERTKLDDVLLEMTIASDNLQRKLTPQEMEVRLRRAGLLRPEVEALIVRLEKDFNDALDSLYDVLVEEAKRRFKLSATIRDKKITQLNEERARQKDRNYFPLSRFGNYTVTIRNAVGEQKSFEIFETEKEAEERKAEHRKANPSDMVSVGKVSDLQRSFMGMPRALLESLKDKLKLDSTQMRELDELLFELAPGQSYRKRRIHRKNVPGYSRDGMRAYADYFQHFANHLSRVKHYAEMTAALSEVDDYIKVRAKAPDANVVKEQQVREYLDRHYEYAMNPGNELANLRSFGFLWYLGFVPKSAFINLTQVPLVTYPYLSARYGDAATVTELTRALKDMRKVWHRGQGLEPDMQIAIERGIQAGFLDESLATELAGMAEGSNLQRLLPGTFLKSKKAARLIRQSSYYAAWMFQKAEQFNRLQTFTAAYRLERAKLLAEMGLTMDTATTDQHKEIRRKAFEAARGAVEGSQFEYARWNRPEFMRGQKSAFFLFFNYLQNILYFAAKDPGRLRFLILMVLFAGLQGFPGAEDALDLADLAATKYKEILGYKNPKVDLRTDAREFIQELGANPDLIMHGLSHETFGLKTVGDALGVPMPHIDMSGSLSLGRIIPGLEPLVRAADTGFQDLPDAISKSAVDAGGALLSIPFGILKAVSSTDPDQFKRWESAVPTAIRGLMRATRYALDGEETDRYGAGVVEFDPKDMNHMTEVVAQALGARSGRVAREQELRWVQQEHIKYYQSRRAILQRQYAFAFMSKDRQAKAEALQRIRAYNGTVPNAALKISQEQIEQSLRSRLTQQKLSEMGYPRSKRDIPLTRDLERRAYSSSPRQE